MAEEMSAGQAPPRRFDVVRRGYDRAQVDEHLNDLAALVDELRAAAAEAEASTLAIGIDDPEALAQELRRVGEGVASILEAARAAAEGLRTRATTDADNWRMAAEQESASMLDGADEQSKALRGSAWKEGTALLAAAAAEAKAILDAAQQDALFMRAEAERDALRLTSDARRDKDDVLRTARLEAESVLAEARAESDGLLASAHRQAEAAQERARALEDRRSELLKELEATRASIANLEEEIDSRRQELEAPPEEPEPDPDLSHHDMDVGSVKIVSPSKAVTLRPVDTDELVAEIEALRSSGGAATPKQPVETVAVISPPEPQAVPPADTAPEATAPEVAAPVDADQPEPAPAPEVTAPVDTDEPEPAPAPASTLLASDGPVKDEIGSLFAQLRTVEHNGSMPSQPSLLDAVPATETPERRAAEPTEQRATTAPQVSALEDQPEDDIEAARDEQGEPNESLAGRNAALRSIKKLLVELQNETLEALRGDDTWVPPDGFADRFGAPFVELRQDTGQAAASAFASDLEDSVTSAIEHARAAGKGSRAVASQASKVFRLWRSDEAERRVGAL